MSPTSIAVVLLVLRSEWRGVRQQMVDLPIADRAPLKKFSERLECKIQELTDQLLSLL